MPNPQPSADLLTTGDVARRAGVSSQAVKRWARRGVLLPEGRTEGGIRLYRREDVEAFLATRAAR
jgi:DNA-binding transcriptional MerR regulator